MSKKSYQELEDIAQLLMENGQIDEGTLLHLHVMDLRDREKKLGTRPVCPICKENLERVRYKGYYDQFDYWDCLCGSNVKVERVEIGAYG